MAPRFENCDISSGSSNGSGGMVTNNTTTIGLQLENARLH